MSQKINVHRENEIVFLTMDALPRPPTIDDDLCGQLVRALAEVSGRNGDRTVVIRALGPAFSAGGNLFEIEQRLADPQQLAPMIDRFHEAILAIRHHALPIVASVHGAAAGAGFSLAMACDLVVAAESARFIAGYPKIGTSSDGGLSFQLAHRLGATRAIDAFLLGESLDAEAAYKLGIVNRLVADADLESETLAVAQRLAAQPAYAVGQIKELIGSVANQGLERHLALEKEAFIRCAGTPDFVRLVGAFTRKSSRQ